jgi:N-acetylglucosamine-6-phosphate deacetylase
LCLYFSFFDFGSISILTHGDTETNTTTAMTYSPNDLIKLTNCRLAMGDKLIPGDLWICASTGKIIDQQAVFYEQTIRPSSVHDLGGRILAPGLIDVQLNGGWGFDFSVPTERPQDFKDGVEMVNKQLIKTGVTSYLPTIISSRSHVYEKVYIWIHPIAMIEC